MLDSSEIDWLFIRLKNGELTEEEKKKLQDLIQQSPEYKNAATFHQAFDIAFENPKEMELYHHFEEMYHFASKKRKVNTIYRIAAIGIILIGVGSIYLVLPLGRTDESDLYKSYYQVFSPPDQYRASVTYSHDLANTAFSFYSKADFKNAERCFDGLIIKDPQNTSYLFYEGICRLENSAPDRALQNFQKLISCNDPVFKSPSLWYSSLCLIKMKNIKEARIMLQQVVDEKGVFSIKAKELLQKIKP